MKNFLILSLALTLSGCMSIQQRIDRARFGDNPYVEDPFWARYATSDSDLDRSIRAYLDALRAEPDNPTFHNELGRLLVEKGFPNDAEREFRRALAIDDEFYPAWYNLALVRSPRGENSAALEALDMTLDAKPGHASALFQKGLILERMGNSSGAIEAYAEAFRINYDLLRPKINPQIIESRLIERALISLYPNESRRRSLLLQPTPPDLRNRASETYDVVEPEEILSPEEASEPVAGESPSPPPGG